MSRNKVETHIVFGPRRVLGQLKTVSKSKQSTNRILKNSTISTVKMEEETIEVSKKSNFDFKVHKSELLQPK
jgi:hypothetical protein